MVQKIGKNKKIIYIIGLFLVLGIIAIVIAFSSVNQPEKPEKYPHVTYESTTPHSPVSENGESQQISELENSPELKAAINRMIRETYESEYNARLDSYSVMEVISDDEIKVSIDVIWTNTYGEEVTDHYEGTWYKRDGTWTDGWDLSYPDIKPDNTIIYRIKDGKMYDPTEPMY